MCGGGGNAAAAAQQQEQARQTGIANATAKINSIYGSPQRQQQYSDFEKAIQSYNLNQLNQQKTDADRQLNFAMARQGLTGGSADADASANLMRQYNEGVLKSAQGASSAAANLKTADQAQKQQLIGLAQSGLDASSAANQATTGMQTNLDTAMAQGESQGLGDMFGALASYYDQANQAKQLRGLLSGQQVSGLYGMQTNYQMPTNTPGALAIGRSSNPYLNVK